MTKGQSGRPFGGRTVREIIADPKTPRHIRDMMSSAVDAWTEFDAIRRAERFAALPAAGETLTVEEAAKLSDEERGMYVAATPEERAGLIRLMRDPGPPTTTLGASTIKCPTCRGERYTFSPKRRPCSQCRGTGSLTIHEVSPPA